MLKKNCNKITVILAAVLCLSLCIILIIHNRPSPEKTVINYLTKLESGASAEESFLSMIQTEDENTNTKIMLGEVVYNEEKTEAVVNCYYSKQYDDFMIVKLVKEKGKWLITD